MGAKVRKTQEHGLPYLVIGLGLLRDSFGRRGPAKRYLGWTISISETEKIRAGAEHWFAKIGKRFGGRKTSDREDAAK